MPNQAIVRIGILLLSQATSPQPAEDTLLREQIVAYHPTPSSHPHANSTNVADLRGGWRGFHKPLAGIDQRLADLYGHDQIGVALNECAAWRLARRLGPPFNLLVPPTVLRWHRPEAASQPTQRNMADGWGSLSLQQPGLSMDLGPLQDPRLCDPAAFFDALIAQQDRHAGQFRWESASGRLGLIDHGFAFARPQNRLNDSVFLARRHSDGRGALHDDERQLLALLDKSGNLGGLREILAPDQADALAKRISRMLASGRLIMPGDW